MKAQLILEDGIRFTGTSYGSEGTVLTEVVFNTSMSGYEEVWTDPSYCGQLVVMTYPAIGNIGLNRQDAEAIKPSCDGVITRHISEYPSHWRNQMDVTEWFQKRGLFLIADCDTRMLTRHLRRFGTMKGLVTTGALSPAEVQDQMAQPLRRDLVKRVTTKDVQMIPGNGPRIVLIDFGVKASIVRAFVERQCEIMIVPFQTTLEEIMAYAPDGIVLSNGPGDPCDVAEDVLPTIRTLLEQKIPLFGVGLGHQLLALAGGAQTEKMTFGHRGANHPVKEVLSGRGWMTAQNHSYTVIRDSVTHTDLQITHVSLHDGTIEGLRHNNAPAFSVQFHPLSGLGDTGCVFDTFMAMIERGGTAVAQTS